MIIKLINNMPCFYCKRTGHNVRSCNSIDLILFHELCRLKIARYENTINMPRDKMINNFVIWMGFYIINENLYNTLYAYCKSLLKIKQNFAFINYLKFVTNKLFRLEDDYNHEIIRNSSWENTKTFFRTEFIKMNPDHFHSITSCIKRSNLSASTQECCICYEIKQSCQFITLNCNHNFCITCISNQLSINSNKIPTCAYCRTAIEKVNCPNKITYDQFNSLINNSHIIKDI